MNKISLIILTILHFLFMPKLFSQAEILNLKVGETYLTSPLGTALYQNSDLSGRQLVLVPGRSPVKVLGLARGKTVYVEYKGYKGYITSSTFAYQGKATSTATSTVLGINDQIKEFVEKEINAWQKKGEFEKTVDFQRRVNQQTRDQKWNCYFYPDSKLS